MGPHALKPGLNTRKRHLSKSPSPSRTSKQSRRPPSPEEGEVEDTEAPVQSSSSQAQHSQQSKRKSVAFPFKSTQKPVVKPPVAGAKNVFEKEETKARQDGSHRGRAHVAAPIPARKEPAIYERPESPPFHERASRSPSMSTSRRPHRIPDRDWDNRDRERDRGRDSRDRGRSYRYTEDERYESSRRYPPYDDHYYHHSGGYDYTDYRGDDRRERPYSYHEQQPWQPNDRPATDNYRPPLPPPGPSEHRPLSPSNSARSLESPRPVRRNEKRSMSSSRLILSPQY